MAEDPHPDAIRSGLDLLAVPGRVIEIRIMRDDGVGSGYFDDLEKAASALLSVDSDPHVTGIYVTLNEVNPTLLARRANRIKFRLGKKDSSTGDSDIISRRWLPIDIDPVRPSGVSSSAQEHADALSRADSIAEFLTGIGWPRPVIADSGNGAHLLYAIDLPNDDESRTLVRLVLESLDWRFSDSTCKVDTANSNASRIWKVYGTISRKGDNLPDRPHRRSRVLLVPENQGSPDLVVSGEQLRSLVSMIPDTVTGLKQNRSSGQIRTFVEAGFDLASWLSEHGLSCTEKPYGSGRLFVFDDCPFSSAHSDGAYAIQFDNGAIFAGCHHDSCGGGTQRWPELRAMFEPGKPDTGTRLARLRSDRIRAKNEAEGRSRPTESELAQAMATYEAGTADTGSVAGDDEPEEPLAEILSRCTGILESGDPLSFML